MSKLPNLIYASIIAECERMENKDIYKGNGHHLAQRLTYMIAAGILPRHQKVIYDALETHPTSTSHVARKIKMPVSYVASQLLQMRNKTTNVLSKRKGRFRLWYKDTNM